MHNEILVALIALAGVLISVVMSVFTSRGATSTEIQKLRTEIQQAYAGRLLEERLKVYPEMYYLLSDFRKRVRAGTYSKDDLDELRAQTDEWNSKNSLLFSGLTNSISYRFRQVLYELTQDTAGSSATLGDLRTIAGEFELALKSDIGVFVVEFADPSRVFVAYNDLMEEVMNQPVRRRRKPQ